MAKGQILSGCQLNSAGPLVLLVTVTTPLQPEHKHDINILNYKNMLQKSAHDPDSYRLHEEYQ